MCQAHSIQLDAADCPALEIQTSFGDSQLRECRCDTQRPSGSLNKSYQRNGQVFFGSI